MRWISSILFCLAVILTAFGSYAAERSETGDDFVMQVWDTDSGLPHSMVTSIAQTPDGYLWVGTLHGGLARFDGTRFVNFHPGNTPELKSIEIHKLLVDGQGTLWIGNVEGGLISHRDEKFRFEYWNNDTPRSWVEGILASRSERIDFSTHPGIIFRATATAGTNQWETITPTNAHPTAMTCEDAEGVIWYRTRAGQLAQLRGSNATAFAVPPGLLPTVVNVLLKDMSGRICIGTQNGLAVWNGTNFTDLTPTNHDDDVAVRQIMPSADGGFWVLTSRHLRKYLDGVWTVSLNVNAAKDSQNFPSDELSDCTPLFTDSQNGLWFGRDQKGLARVTREGCVSWVKDADSKIVGGIQCSFEDREGNIWLGLNEGGLVRLRPRIFHPVWPRENVDSKSARSVCEDEKGVMWFGSGGRQVVRWQDGDFAEFTAPATHFYEEVKVLPDGAGGIWSGSVQNGLVHLENGDFTRPFDEKKIGTVVRCMLRNRQGRLWIGSEFGLFCWNTNGLKTFTAQDGFQPAYILSLAEDKNGDLWCGTALGGLRWLHDGKFTAFRPADSLTDEATLRAANMADPMGERNRGALSGGERFWALHFDEDGVLWIGTLGGGLLRFKDGQFKRFTTHDDLPSEHISQILEDDFNQLWLGTRAGVVRVSRRELNAFADGGNELPNFVAYGKSDGLPALECSGGSQPSCWQGRDGRLWFTTVRGAVWVDPATLRVNRLPPPVHIEDVRVDGDSVFEKNAIPHPANQVRIAAGRHYVEFKFCALSFNSPDKVKFKWRLPGLEKDWVDGGDRRSASYSFLPPGSYRFEVKACNNDGVWNDNPTALELTVLPYFWQLWWFKAGVALLVVGLGVLIYSVRVARLRALERMRLRIARDLHDEVGANLGSISLIAQMMEQTPSSSDATQVRGIAVQTIDTLRDIIWFIDPKHDKLSDLVLRLEETARMMLATVKYKFSQQGDFRSADLSLAFRRNVPPLFKETLHNILKHSHATEVNILVCREVDQFQFRIQDNGIGFDPSQKNSGNGLRNLRKRAMEIHGAVVVESAPGSGTVVTFTAPITQTRDWFKSGS